MKVQTSVYGLTKAVQYGRVRVPGNLIWYADFKAIKQEEQSESGKGGGGTPSRVYYIYTASMLIGIGEGFVGGVRRIWRGKQKFEGKPVETHDVTVAESHRPVIEAGNPIIRLTNSGQWIKTVRVVIEKNFDAYTGIEAEDEAARWYPGRAIAENKDFFLVSPGVYRIAAHLENTLLRIEYVERTHRTELSALQDLGMFLVQQGGRYVVPDTWQHLTDNHPAQAVPYSHLAYVGAVDYALGDSANSPNHNFEIDSKFQIDVANGNFDASPPDIVYDLLTNQRYGASFPLSLIGDRTHYERLCESLGLGFSHSFDSQRPANTTISELLSASMTEAAWTGNQLKFIPMWDRYVGTYQPDKTPVFTLNEDNLKPIGSDIIKVNRIDDGQLNTQSRVEWTDREADYASTVYTLPDDGAAIAYGRRTGSTVSMPFVMTKKVIHQIASAKHHQAVSQRNEYEFLIPGSYIELEPGDLVTLDLPKKYLLNRPVMVRRITDRRNERRVFAVDFPVNHVNAPQIDPPVSSGFVPELNAPAGSVDDPAFFEPPGNKTVNGLEVGIAVSGASEEWGGCDVFVSDSNGESYRKMDTMNEGSRYGTIQTDLAASEGQSLTIKLIGAGGKIFSLGEQIAQSQIGVIFVGDTATGEFINYKDAELVAKNTYRLTGLSRALNGTKLTSHLAGSKFIYFDQALATTGPLDESAIGKTLKFKFQSFNRHGGGIQSLDQLPAYSYKVTGRFKDLRGLPYVPNLITNASMIGNVVDNYEWRFLNMRDDLQQSTFMTEGWLASSTARPRLIRCHGSSRDFSKPPNYGPEFPDSFVIGGPKVGVTPGKEYVMFADIIASNVEVRIVPVMYTRAANSVVYDVEFGQPSDYAFTNKFIYQNDEIDPADFQRLSIKFKPDSDVFMLSMNVVVKSNDNNASSPFATVIYRPLIGESIPGEIGLPPWSPGA